MKKAVYDIVNRPHKSIQILKARPVYKIKRDSIGDIIKFKVRVVVKGYLQKFGISYFDVFAPVSTVDGFRIIICIATQRNWGLRQFDVSTAYLNAPIEEEIYVEPPPGFEEPDCRIWLLKKSLYGAKQSAKNWGDLLAKTLREYGFKLASADHYIWTTEELFIGLHVDGLAVAYATEPALDKFTAFIGGEGRLHRQSDDYRADCATRAGTWRRLPFGNEVINWPRAAALARQESKRTISRP